MKTNFLKFLSYKDRRYFWKFQNTYEFDRYFKFIANVSFFLLKNKIEIKV